MAAMKRAAISAVLKVFRINAFAASDNECLIDWSSISALTALASEFTDP